MGFLLAHPLAAPSARSSGGPLGWAVLGNALGYPLLLAFTLRSVTTSHAAW